MIKVFVSIGLLSLGALGCASTNVGATAAPAAAPSAPAAPAALTVPAALAVPAGATVAAHYHAVGVQVYACAAAPGGASGFTWTLKRPEATLSDGEGHAAGTHGAGPTWTSSDGSSVAGKKLAQADAPDATAIPWLLVRAVSTMGTGMFTDVTFIQRVSTSGGKAPATGCGADNVGAETRADYAADYVFYRGGV